jgi:hypothetical protein
MPDTGARRKRQMLLVKTKERNMVGEGLAGDSDHESDSSNSLDVRVSLYTSDSPGA